MESGSQQLGQPEDSIKVYAPYDGIVEIGSPLKSLKDQAKSERKVGVKDLSLGTKKAPAQLSPDPYLVNEVLQNRKQRTQAKPSGINPYLNNDVPLQRDEQQKQLKMQ